MNDKELADRVVALGIGEYHSTVNRGGITIRSHPGYGMPDDLDHEYEHEKFFVRDWRVAGALMEKVIEWGGFDFVGSCTTDTFQATAYRGYGHRKKINHGVNESLPRAIIEACVEALDDR